MDLLLQLFVNGVINGAHYALLGVGFGLIFATTRIVHFAYGPVFTFAAYVAWGVSGGLGGEKLTTPKREKMVTNSKN